MCPTPESGTVTLEKAALLKAHSEGCADVRKTLEKMYPAVFQPEKFLPTTSGSVVLLQCSGRARIVVKENTTVRYVGFDCNVKFHQKFDISNVNPTTAIYVKPADGKLILTVRNGKIVDDEYKAD